KEEPRELPKKEAPKPPPRKPAPPTDGEPALPRSRPLSDDPREAHSHFVERVRQAIRLLPIEPLPYFLTAQSLVAQGKYHEAHDTILAGLRLRPDWPQ